MKNTPYIFALVLIALGCSEPQQVELIETEIITGKYYTNERQRTDTIVFHKNEPNSMMRGWGQVSWEMTQDSLYQSDSRGMSYYFGKNKGSYVINNDTIYVTFKAADQPNNELKRDGCIMEKYVVIQSSDSLLMLVNISDTTNGGYRIGGGSMPPGDIVLR
ncbi:MAG: hypothetical protein QNK23_06075 [Crocinitomicaceae bacterium]|nr:hypothetical protein [Crocinitomicaceae bacterium]